MFSREVNFYTDASKYCKPGDKGVLDPSDKPPKQLRLVKIEERDPEKSQKSLLHAAEHAGNIQLLKICVFVLQLEELDGSY